MLPTPALFTALTLDILLQKPKGSKDGRKKSAQTSAYTNLHQSETPVGLSQHGMMEGPDAARLGFFLTL